MHYAALRGVGQWRINYGVTCARAPNVRGPQKWKMKRLFCCFVNKNEISKQKVVFFNSID